MRRWCWLGLGGLWACSEPSDRVMVYWEPPLIDCRDHDGAPRPLGLSEPADNGVSFLDVREVVAAHDAATGAYSLTDALSPDDFGPAELTLRLHPETAATIHRQVDEDSGEQAYYASQQCVEGDYLRIEGTASISVPWKGQQLTDHTPVRIEAWGATPAEMRLVATFIEWYGGEKPTDDWRALICSGLEFRSDCGFQSAGVEIKGPLDQPTLVVSAVYRRPEYVRATVVFGHTWTAP